MLLIVGIIESYSIRYYKTNCRMKKILCAFILITFVNISSRTIFAQNHYMEIDSLLIHYVDFNLMTMVDISCDNFESALVYKTVVLRDSSCIAELTDIFWEKM